MAWLLGPDANMVSPLVRFFECSVFGVLIWENGVVWASALAGSAAEEGRGRERGETSERNWFLLAGEIGLDKRADNAAASRFTARTRGRFS